MDLRTKININEGWSFTGPSGGTQRVDLPHTWNSVDGQDGGNDYWRGTCIYCRTFSKPEFTAEQRVYLEFQGVNASAKVELNGTFVGIHNGGYSTFRWDVTELISGSKELIVQNYNHPPIVVWGVPNEITISTKDKADMLDNHRALNDLYHQLDPTRLTTLACYAMCGPFNKTARITDVVSWNLYLGWYAPGLFLNDFWIGFFHKCYPDRTLGYSE